MRKSKQFQHARSLAVSMLALATLGASQAYAADKADAGLSPAARFALQRDLGVMPGQVAQYLETEKLAVRRQHDARATLGDSFAGAWLERNRLGEFEMVVATTQSQRLGTARGLGAQARVVAHSLATLETTQSRLDAAGKRLLGARSAARDTDSGIHSWHIDLKTNSVVVTADPAALDIAKDFVVASGADTNTVRFETSELRPQPAFDIRGGDRYNLPGGGWCSIGFSVTQGGWTGFATAGHCGGVGTAVSGFNGVAIGSVAGSTFPGADIAWVRNTNPGSWAIQPWVNNYSGGNIGVIGGLEQPVGGLICRSGARTGYRCGYVAAKNVTVNYPAGQTFGLVQSSACLGQGDSGGSFVTPWGEAQGVASGGFLSANGENCSIASPISYHQPIQPILNAYGLVLQNIPTCGRMNPGRVLGTGGTVTSCDGRFTLAMQTDGHLVLYQAGVGAIWWNNVFGAGHTLHMQTDGNLVVYNNVGQARWNTGTWGRNGAFLSVQNDGNVVVYSHQGQALWASGTCCR